MKLTNEEKKKLDEVKRQISMEREYSNRYFQYPLFIENKSNNFGFVSIISISTILTLIMIILLIIL